MEFSIEMKYVLDTFWLLLAGILVMWMAAGFTMLESGLVRTKNTTAILTKNIAIYATACISYFLLGYNFMYGDGNTFMGLGTLLGGINVEGHSLLSDFFFQVVFVATAASIVSGVLAERVKFWSFMVFVVVLTTLIYPIQGHWTWGGSNLFGLFDGFSDFAGGTIVHSVGGWAALAGVLLLGPRYGKYDINGNTNPIQGANIPIATLGTFILWFGWFGFNGGSQLALGSKSDVDIISMVIVNTNIAACGGAIVALILTQLFYKKIDLTMALNGALSGLVAITAGPNYSSMLIALLIGSIGGVLVVLAVPFFDKLKIDDPVGALSVHLVNGIWGTIAVGVFNPEVAITSQLTGVVVIGVFTFLTSYFAWTLIKLAMGIRVTKQQEIEGIDVSEFGLHSYPEFIE